MKGFYLSLIGKTDKILPTANTIGTLKPIAKPLPIALPPIVIAAINPVMVSETIVAGKICIPLVSFAIIPEISPTTSLQKLETWFAFRESQTASFAPETFLDAIEWNSFSVADVAAIPITSKIMPMPINISKIIKDFVSKIYTQSVNLEV